MTGEEVKKIRAALSKAVGRRVSQLDFATMLGMTGTAALDTIRGWEEGSLRVSGPAAIALRYLSQGLPGFRGKLSEWSYERDFHRDHANLIVRHWWPRAVIAVDSSSGWAVLGDVRWIDDPLDQGDVVVRAAREAFVIRLQLAG